MNTIAMLIGYLVIGVLVLLAFIFIVAQISCAHEWEPNMRTSCIEDTDEGEASVNSTYYFKCRKCGKSKVVRTVGIDPLRTPENVVTCWEKSHHAE